ncbi:hypothetical protein N431DRAFT_403768 [Stipitochalara longipes BDJ]|nr:hypothetical protein N431DRAFT_403768 [Stipitochalara longipes BDJ]
MSTKHSHRRINESLLHADPKGSFTPCRQNVMSFADHMISSSKHRDFALSDLQKTALHDFHNKPKFDLREDRSFSTMKVISAYFGFLDDLFFFGNMREREKAVIMLRSQPDQYEGRHEKMKAYVEKMLHFMIHAFLELWTCDHASCSAGFGKLGKTGHGRVWQDIALAVEDAVRDEGFLNLDLGLDREKGLALELLAMEEDVRREDLERWGMGREDVEDEIEEAREAQEDDDGHSRTIQGTKPRNTGILQTFLLGAEVMGIYLHAYRFRHDLTRLNLIRERLAHRKK